MASIEMPFGVSDLDAVFALSDLLDNKEELVKEFMPEVEKYLVKSTFFTGHAKLLYHVAFDDLIVTLIKRQVIKHFPNLNPEEVLLLCEPDFLKLIGGSYFDPEVYKKQLSMERTN